jgi:DsbC/DsbD-like thiol-disulfide interchange protein
MSTALRPGGGRQRRTRRLAAAGALLLLLTTGAAAQDRSTAAPVEGLVRTQHLVAVPSVTPAADGRVTLVLSVTLAPGMHVYAPEEKRYIRVSLTLTKPSGLEAHPAVYPKGEPFYFEPTGETQIVYSGAFTVRQTIRRPQAAANVTGALRYQACDDRVCYLPKTISIDWRVK